MQHAFSSQDQQVLNTVINNIPAMVFYKNLKGEYVAANEMFCKQLKTTPEAIVGKTDFDFYEYDRAVKYQATDLEVLLSDGVIEGFEEEISIDDEIKIFATRKVLIKDRQGSPYGIIGLAYDITETRKAEQDIIESRTTYKYMYDMFRLMADNIPDLLWAKDLRKRYLFANKAICEKLLNASDTDEPIGKTDMFFAERERLKHPDDSEWHSFGEICSDSDELTMKTKSPGRFDEYGNVGGQYLFLDVQKAPILDEEGNMIGTVGSGRDITQQKLMEKEFHALNQRNHAIIEALPDLMFLYDQDGNFLNCYASNLDELIAPPEAIIGKNITEFVDPLLAQQTLKSIRNCLAGEKNQTFEYQIFRNNTHQYYEARFSRVDDHQVLVIARNITERKLLQFELIQARDKAEESSRLKTTLLNNMSHELRTPLNGILGFSEIMSDELKDQEYAEMASHIYRSGKRLMKTLDSIMQLSQLESGTKSIHADKIQLREHFKQIFESFYHQATAKNLSFEIRNIPDSIGYTDSFFFTQAVTNLLDNAIKFTQSGGIVINCCLNETEGIRNLHFQIEDTGIGISDQHLKLIFEEFRQASEGQNRSFEGTGLGLTISKKMIKLLGGEIVVESVVDKGSVFTIRIPFPEKPGSQKISVFSSKDFIHDDVRMGPGPENNPILLVEDNEVNAQLTLAYLKGFYTVEWAIDALSALEMVKNKKYSVILMDINLGPGMDGLQVTKHIRMLPGYEQTPVIAITGYTMFGDRDQLIEGGCTDYIPKPFTRNDLTALLKRILPDTTLTSTPE
jgi:PAS domain S-box-containing protein